MPMSCLIHVSILSNGKHGRKETIAWTRRKIITIVHSEYNAKIIQVYAQKGETCTWDHYLFATALPQMLTARLSNKKRFLELAAYCILDQSKEFAKTEQRSLHEYFAPTTPAESLQNITELRRTPQGTTTQPKISSGTLRAHRSKNNMHYYLPASKQIILHTSI